MREDLQIDTFRTADLPGSRQFLHFFPTKDEMEIASSNYQIEDEFDHSFIYFENPQNTHVLWKNRAGPIQFCGSGAYALGWLLTDQCHLNAIEIFSNELKISSYISLNNCYLKIPAILPTSVKETEEHHLYSNENSGIHILQLFDEQQIKDNNWVDYYQENQNLSNIHTLCVFYWDKNKKKGTLRYFAPRYGRKEDYVTGSIHQYLTPLVYELTGTKKQVWYQDSKSPGRVISIFNNHSVLINGSCSSKEKKKISNIHDQVV